MNNITIDKLLTSTEKYLMYNNSYLNAFDV